MSTYVAGWNTPGCLPDTAEPLPEFETLAEAWEYLADEIARDAAEVDGAPYSQADFDLLTFDAASIDRTRPGSFELAGLAYFVQQAESDPVAEAHAYTANGGCRCGALPLDSSPSTHARHVRAVSAAPTCHGCADPTQHPHAFDCEAAR